MNNKLFLGLVVLAAGAIVGWFVFGADTPLTDTTERGPEELLVATGASGRTLEEESSATGQMMDKGGVAAQIMVVYSDTGFAPVTVTVKQGSMVTFVNESTKGMWVASAVHPTHQLLPGFDQKASVQNGGTYAYTFTKVGTWTYHNHENPTHTATIVVTQ